MDTKTWHGKGHEGSGAMSAEVKINVRCTFRSPDSFVLPLRELVKEGSLSEELINDRVRDILRVKFLLGLFDNPYQTDLEAADRGVETPESEAIALQASRESLVLLKNDSLPGSNSLLKHNRPSANGILQTNGNPLLPLDITRLKKIAVCGPNADETSYALTH